MSEKGLHSVGEAYASGVSVTRGKGDDVFVKADDSVLLLDKAQANHLLVALEAELVEDDNE